MAKKCDTCNKSFKNAHGVSVHKQRSLAGSPCKRSIEGVGAGVKQRRSAGQRRSTTRTTRRNNGETGRAAMRQILSAHPQGLPISQIADKLREKGFKLHPGYISQAAASDPTFVRVERGVYRLKKNLGSQTTGATVVKEAVSEATEIAELGSEALLLRIETLENQNRAYHDAHLCLMRGISV